MGILTDSQGMLKMELIHEIDEKVSQKVKLGETLTVTEAEALADKASRYFSRSITSYNDCLGTLGELDQSSMGRPEGHEGLNNFFLAICKEAIDRERLQKEIVDALKITR